LCRSSMVACAVMAMIGTFAKRSSALSLLVAWKPSISGICRSISTTSNGGGAGPSDRLCTPSRPLPATRTVAPHALQQFDGDLRVDLVVFDEQDVRAPEPIRVLVYRRARAAVTSVAEEVRERVDDR